MANIGIDFGTTNSLIVAYDKRKHEFNYFNFEGIRPVPTSSTVMYYDNKKTVGKEARAKMFRYDGVEGYHFEKSIKTKLGTDYETNIFGKNVAPYVVASEILTHLKSEAINKWNAIQAGVDLNKSVFTIPVKFSGKARKELRKAANDAGIEVTTFIHEPFAAIVGYYFTKDNNSTFSEVISNLRTLDGQFVLTFDWGGGTLDITVVKIENDTMCELGTAELTNLAGDKFDEELALYVWNKFCSQYSKKYSSDYLEMVRKKRWGRILAIAETCKIELSKYEETEFLLESVTGDEDVDIDLTITREDFEKIIYPIIVKAINKIDDAIRQAGINDNKINHVLLTGGTCYIPAVQKYMREKFGHRVETVKNADLLIAQGAAVISELEWTPFLTKDILIEMCNNSYWPMFTHNKILATGEPITVNEYFTCVDQREKRAKVIIGEGLGQTCDKILAVLNVPVLCDNRFGDDILISGTIDTDIVLKIDGRSMLVKGYKQKSISGIDEEYSERVSTEINQLCFGLSFKGE